MHLHAGLAEHLVGVIELRRFGQMGDVPGMNNEGRLDLHGLHDADRLAQRAQCVGIGRLIESDMAVAHLQKREARRLGRQSLADQSDRVRHAAADGPQHPGARPNHAFEYLAAAEARSAPRQSFF